MGLQVSAGHGGGGDQASYTDIHSWPVPIGTNYFAKKWLEPGDMKKIHWLKERLFLLYVIKGRSLFMSRRSGTHHTLGNMRPAVSLVVNKSLFAKAVSWTLRHVDILWLPPS